MEQLLETVDNAKENAQIAMYTAVQQVSQTDYSVVDSTNQMMNEITQQLLSG